MTEDEILAKAQQMAAKHKQDILDARADLVKELLAAGYKPDEWVICDNMVDIRAGITYDYKCWASKKNPIEL